MKIKLTSGARSRVTTLGAFIRDNAEFSAADVRALRIAMAFGREYRGAGGGAVAPYAVARAGKVFADRDQRAVDKAIATAATLQRRETF